MISAQSQRRKAWLRTDPSRVSAQLPLQSVPTTEHRRRQRFAQLPLQSSNHSKAPPHVFEVLQPPVLQTKSQRASLTVCLDKCLNFGEVYAFGPPSSKQASRVCERMTPSCRAGIAEAGNRGVPHALRVTTLLVLLPNVGCVAATSGHQPQMRLPRTGPSPPPASPPAPRSSRLPSTPV